VLEEAGAVTLPFLPRGNLGGAPILAAAPGVAAALAAAAALP